MLFELNLFITFIASHLLLGAMLILVLLAAIKVCRVHTELQSWLWATALLVCISVPFLSLAGGDQIGASLPPPTPAVHADAVAVVTDANLTKHATVSPTKNQSEVAVPGRWVKQARHGVYLLLGLWLLGALWRLTALAISVRHTRALIRSATLYHATPYRVGPYRATSYRDSLQSAVTCPLLVSAQIAAPMAVGLWRPVILLPATFVENFTAERLRPIVLHEWAHIRRRDLWVGALQEFIAVFFWWSPVLRMINHRMHVSRELACDLRAAQLLNSGKRFAQSLLDCAELLVTRQQAALGMNLFRKKKELTERINAVLKFKPETKPGQLATLAACALCAAASLAVAHEYGPRINLVAMTGQGQYASGLTRAEGERLIAVVRDGDVTALQTLLNNNININAPVLGEGTALIEAVRQGNRPMVELLLSAGADVNLPSPGDGNPMIAAAQHNRLQLAELLFQRGANLDAVVPRDGSPLIVAIRSGHEQMAEQLLAWGADANRAAERDGNPLIAAAMTGNLKIARQLVQRGADVNGIVPRDETPLINAANRGRLQMVKFLVENGADVNLGVKTSGGEFRTPLNRAANDRVRNYLRSVGASE
ncbi:M56 family metallopeptidase [Microbulbifer sp. SAOS-129_SWC]|uniref:M56 family metallopeptidase n=1 Tax=Microbulbifer sp. SAOS-129_SWC TaxID=3145235 RepID=UPI003217ECAF